MSVMTPAKVTAGPLLWFNLIVVWIVWGSTYIGILFATESIPPFFAMGTRFIAAFLIMVVLTGVTRGWDALRVTRKEFASASFMGVALLGVGLGTVGLAQDYVPTGVMALIIAATPLTIVLWRIGTGDRPARLTLVGVVIGLLGIGWMLLPGGTRPVSGTDADVVFWSIMILISSTIWATTSFFSARLPKPKDSFTLTTYELLSGGLALLIVSLLVGEEIDFGSITARSWGGWIFLVLAGSVLAFSSFTWLINNAPISLASTYAYVNPAVAVILGVLLYAEVITSDVVIGLTVVLGGVILVVTGESVRSKRASQVPETEVT
ncbi:MAG: EamA family transporter [Candidatus Nanopelagicales bacterium]|jgi:drug/metabolite transporter (DMT)-like permease